jgi:predicted RNase H-like nuclease
LRARWVNSDKHKRKPEGYLERANLLSGALGIHVPTRTEARKLSPAAAADDILDALVAAWTVLRFVGGTAERIPAQPQLGINGLSMEMWY